ncbi:hypothetical protein BDFB_011707 [Asbolus verrucosus]|uniref:Uncharacterized protein n=1 Tax=Asbolus verrucosus TaxID=1661398 RepID=A0A482VLN4_ASBVE|nr:hypothetical protein BDFB_011707 [Asbolus verrucosus]
MEPKCKCYTPSTVLISSSNQTANYTNYIPTIDINHHDCCIEKEQYLEIEPMEPLKLTNLNLNELRHSQHKLQQFDEILQTNLNKPFIVQHTKWYNVVLGVIITIVIIAPFIIAVVDGATVVD